MKYRKAMAAMAAFTLVMAAFAVEVTRTDVFDGVDTTSEWSCIIDCSKHATRVDADASPLPQSLDSLISTWMESLSIYLRSTPPSGAVLLLR